MQQQKQLFGKICFLSRILRHIWNNLTEEKMVTEPACLPERRSERVCSFAYRALGRLHVKTQILKSGLKIIMFFNISSLCTDNLYAILNTSGI